MSIIANAFLRMAEKVAVMRGSEPMIELDHHSMEISFVKPSNNNRRAWDDLYQWGALFIKDTANPIKVDPETADVVSSDYYASLMRQHVIEQATNTEGAGKDDLKKLQIVTMVLVLGVGAAVVLI